MIVFDTSWCPALALLDWDWKQKSNQLLNLRISDPEECDYDTQGFLGLEGSMKIKIFSFTAFLYSPSLHLIFLFHSSFLLTSTRLSPAKAARAAQLIHPSTSEEPPLFVQLLDIQRLVSEVSIRAWGWLASTSPGRRFCLFCSIINSVSSMGKRDQEGGSFGSALVVTSGAEFRDMHCCKAS